MNASDGVAVIATQIAQTDRRALSEAWYSALHLAHDAKPVRTPAAQRSATDARPAAHTRVASFPAHRRRASQRRRPRVCGTLQTHARRRCPNGGVRRARRRGASSGPWNGSACAVRCRPRTPSTLRAGACVCSCITTARALRIVALCSNPLRDVVERALASARFALAGSGVRVVAP